MLILDARSRIVLWLVAALILSSAGLKADSYAYAGFGGGAFGTLDLNTGVFTSIGSLGQTPAGLAVYNGSIFAASYNGNGTLYGVNTANGSLTAIGNSNIDYLGGFGSTLSGLYAVGADLDLYSINPSTGAATEIGSTGLSGLGSWRDLSTNSSTLYYGDGVDLYTINTSTGLATLVGPLGGTIGAMVTEGGILYGAEEGGKIDTINTTTGAATVVSGGTADSGIWGLAPDPLPAATPEPGSVSLLVTIVAGLIVTKRKKGNPRAFPPQ